MIRILSRLFIVIWLIGAFSVSQPSVFQNSHTVFASSDITKQSFKVSVDTFSPLWTNLVKWSSKQNIDSLLATILNVLILFIGVAAVFFMSIWAWYMIIYHGQDELLSKWKTIFTSWLIALVVALSAWLIIRLFIFILYN